MKPDRPTLERLYLTDRLSTHAIAARCGVSHTSVKRWLRSYNIPRRPDGRGLDNRGIPAPSADDLRRLVHTDHRSYREIAALYGVNPSAVMHWLKKHGIDRPKVWDTRYKGEAPTLPGAATLAALYESGASLASIAQHYGVDPSTIAVRCRNAGVTIRPDGFEGGKRLIATDGHHLRSTYELQVDEWLTAHAIPHLYEPVLPPDRRCHADFLANGWYIEVWGVQGSPQYAQRKRRKQRLYHSHGLPLIEVSRDDFAARRAGRWQRQLARCLIPSPTHSRLF